MHKTNGVVPWFNSREWNGVYEKIYSEQATAEDKIHALKVLHVWKARCPSLPSGIESTLYLLEVYIQDLNEGVTYSDQVLRLAYSTALMRFVNHILDKETAKGASLYQAAHKLGLADWIVDLRHETAHSNKLPSIQLLREAYFESLNWLKYHYWDKYKDVIADYTVTDYTVNNNINVTKDNKLPALLNLYTSLSILSHSKCNIKNLAQIPNASIKESLVSDAMELLDNSLDFSNLKTISINTLSQLLYSKAQRHLKSLSVMCTNKLLPFEDSLFLSKEVYDVFNIGSKRNRKVLNEQYVQCFQGMLHFLHTNDMLKDFIIELINFTRNNDQDKSKCELAAKWVAVILQALKKHQQFVVKMKVQSMIKMGELMSKTEEELRALFYHWYPSYKNNCLLLNLTKPIPKELTDIHYVQEIVASYNPYLIHFINDLLSLVKPCLPEEISKKIYKLTELIAYPERFNVVSSKIYTVEDVKRESETVIEMSPDQSDVKCTNNIENMDSDIEIVKTSEENQSIWQIADSNHNWFETPIGSLPWLASA